MNKIKKQNSIFYINNNSAFVILIQSKYKNVIVYKNKIINVCAVVILILALIALGIKNTINNINILFKLKKAPPNIKVVSSILLIIIWFISNKEYIIKKKPENSVTIPATNSLSHSR